VERDALEARRARHEEIEATQRVDRALDEPACRRSVGKIRGQGHAVAAEGTHHGQGLLGAACARVVVNADAHAGAGQAHRDRTPDASPGASDQGRSPRELERARHSEKVTLAGQLPGVGNFASFSTPTRQSTLASPASSGGVTPAASTLPSVSTYAVASKLPDAPSLHAVSASSSWLTVSCTSAGSQSVGGRTSFGGSNSNPLRASPVVPPMGFGHVFARSAASMQRSVSRSPSVERPRCACAIRPSASIFRKKSTAPPRSSTREAPSSRHACRAPRERANTLSTSSAFNPPISLWACIPRPRPASSTGVDSATWALVPPASPPQPRRSELARSARAGMERATDRVISPQTGNTARDRPQGPTQHGSRSLEHEHARQLGEPPAQRGFRADGDRDPRRLQELDVEDVVPEAREQRSPARPLDERPRLVLPVWNRCQKLREHTPPSVFRPAAVPPREGMPQR